MSWFNEEHPLQHEFIVKKLRKLHKIVSLAESFRGKEIIVLITLRVRISFDTINKCVIFVNSLLFN